MENRGGWKATMGMGYINRVGLIEFANNSNITKMIDANDIARFPTANVEEVVYCNECRFRYTGTCFAKHETADMDYCSCGAKMTEEKK